MKTADSLTKEHDTLNTSDESEHINAKYAQDSFSVPANKKFSIKSGFDYMRISPLKSFHYRFIRGFAYSILVWFNRIAYGLKICGKENLRELNKQGAIFICNHVHPMDCTFVDLGLQSRRMYYITLEDNFKIPVASFFVKSLGGIPIPHKIHLLSEFYSSVIKILKNNSGVCIYPEGSLKPYHDGIREFKSGAFSIAVKAKAPIVPIVITFRKPRGLYKLYKRKPCATVNYLKPIYIDDKSTPSSLSRLCHTIMDNAYNELQE